MTATEPVSSSDDRAIRDVVHQFEIAWNNRDARTLTAAFIETGVYINLHEEVAEGRSAIFQQLARTLATDGEGSYATFSIERVWAALDVSAALLRGRVHVRLVTEEAVRSRHLRLLLALRQSSDGLWRIALLHETILQMP